MHKFIQRNRKKLLAVFGVLLMIVFIIPSTFKNSGTPDDVTVGKVGDEKISSADVRRAAQELQMLQRPLMQLMFMGRSTSGSVPVMFQIVNQCREKPSIYVVLQKEAAAAGVVAPDAEVDELMQRLGGGTTGRDAEDLKAALQRLLSVQLNFERVASQIKVTLPELGKGIIERQEPALNLVEFKAEDYLAGVPNPPDAEVQKAWEKYASVSPDAAGAAMQAVKFGYLVPEKVKLQYIKLPIDRLRNAAFLSLSDNDLVAIDRVAILYYSKNNEEFSTPAFDEREIVAGPFTKPATRPASGPVLKPFREVRDELRRRVVFGDVHARSVDASRVQGRAGRGEEEVRRGDRSAPPAVPRPAGSGLPGAPQGRADPAGSGGPRRGRRRSRPPSRRRKPRKPRRRPRRRGSQRRRSSRLPTWKRFSRTCWKSPRKASHSRRRCRRRRVVASRRN